MSISLVLSPAVWKKLIEFAGLHGIDPGKYVGKICNWIDAVTFARNHEGKVDGRCPAASVRTHEEKILASQHEVLDSSLGRIVIDVEIRVFEEAGQGDPVLERVIDSLHQRIGGIKSALKAEKLLVELLDQWLRFLTSDRQSLVRRLALNLPFDLIQPAVQRENFLAQVVILSSRMSMAANFGLRAVLEQCIEAASCIGLHVADEVLEEVIVPSEGEVGRKIEDIKRMSGVASVNGHFALAHASLRLPVLDFHWAVVSLNDLGGKHLPLGALIQQLKNQGRGLEPVAQRGAGNDRVLSLEDFRLSVLRESVSKLFSHGSGEKAGTWQSTGDGRTRFFGGNNIPLALWARADLLLMLEAFDRMHNLFELVGDLVPNKLSLNRAVWTNQIFRFNTVAYRVRRQILEVYVFLVVPWLSRFGRIGFRRFGDRFESGSRSWIMPLSFRSIVLTLPFLSLQQQLVELCLQVQQKCPQLGIALQRILQLLLKLLDELNQLLSFGQNMLMLFPESQQLFAF